MHAVTISLSVTTFSTKSKVPQPGLGQGQAEPPATPLDSVPMLDLQRQYEQVRVEVLAAVGRVCASQHYILGSEVEAFERELAAFCGASDAVGCASGTDALWLALVAAGVQPGDQVLTTPFSFFASASAIARAGARPVFADIDPRSFNLDPAQVESFLRGGERDKLRALLPVHLYGQCADMESLQRLADEFHLPLIEDAAQAIGARWGRQSCRIHGRVRRLQLLSHKESQRLRRRRSRRPPTAPRWRSTCAACEITAVRAVTFTKSWDGTADWTPSRPPMLQVKLKYVERWNEARRQRASRYDQLFAAAGLTSTGGQPENAAPIQLPLTSAQAHHVFHQYVVRAFRRDELREFLTARKIGTEIYYPLPLHLQPCFTYLGYREGDFPQAERAAKEVLALPMFPELTEDEQRWVVKSIADFYC